MYTLLEKWVGHTVKFDQTGDSAVVGLLINVQSDYATLFTADRQYVHFPLVQLRSMRTDITESNAQVQQLTEQFPPTFQELLNSLLHRMVKIENGEGATSGLVSNVTPEYLELFTDVRELVAFGTGQLKNISPVIRYRKADVQATDDQSSGSNEASAATDGETTVATASSVSSEESVAPVRAQSEPLAEPAAIEAQEVHAEADAPAELPALEASSDAVASDAVTFDEVASDEVASNEVTSDEVASESPAAKVTSTITAQESEKPILERLRSLTEQFAAKSSQGGTGDMAAIKSALDSWPSTIGTSSAKAPCLTNNNVAINRRRKRKQSEADTAFQTDNALTPKPELPKLFPDGFQQASSSTMIHDFVKGLSLSLSLKRQRKRKSSC